MIAYAAHHPALPLRPIRASWVLVGALAAIAAVLVAGPAAALRLGVPLVAFILAVWLYRSRGFPAYLTFTWSLWLFLPGLRRLVDYYGSGWDSSNPISLTPFVVSLLALGSVFHALPSLRRPRLMPWMAAIVALTYGYLSGLVQIGLFPATHAFLSAVAPLALGLATALEWRRYPDCANYVTALFLWGTLLLAAYAILQFFAPPPWDVLWVDGSGMRSVGPAVALKMRVFSLANGPLACAVLLMAGIFVALAHRRPARFVVLPIAAAALLLTLVRSAWIATLIGLMVFAFSLSARMLHRVAGGLLVALALGITLPALMPRETRQVVFETVTARLSTLRGLRGDVSYTERVALLHEATQDILDHPFGHGLGSTGVSSSLAPTSGGVRDFDNGILAVFYALGWLGGVVLLMASGTILLFGMARRESRDDPWARAFRATAVGCLLLSAGGNIFEGLSAAVWWGFAGLLTASHLWNDARLRAAPSRKGHVAPAV